MKNLAKKTILVFAGVTFLLFTLVFGFILVEYVAEGAGLQCVGLEISSGSVLVGLVHVVGFCIAAFLCFLLGIVLCAYGFVKDA